VKASREGEESDEEGIPQLVVNGPTTTTENVRRDRIPAEDLKKPGKE